jgi:apolipoprotein N-acyltransferase
LSLAVLFRLVVEQKPGAAFALTFAWAMGMFGAGVPWIYVSLHVYGNMPALLAMIATLLFCAYLALYPAFLLSVATWLARWLNVGGQRAVLTVLPALFVASELLRGWLLTGFPWLTLGVSQTPGGFLNAPLAGFAPVGGVFLLSVLIALTAGGIALALHAALWKRSSRRVKSGVVMFLASLWVSGALLQQVEWSEPAGASVTASLLQGNIAQDLKWREEAFVLTLSRYRAMVESAPGRLVILPETALPGFLDQIPGDYLVALRRHAQNHGSDLVFGVPTAERDPEGRTIRYFNSALSMGASAAQRYDKHHLVAFGEFIPPLFSWVYRWLDIPLAGFTPGVSVVPPIKVAGVGVAVNICYEDAFGAEIAANARDSNLMANLSNMAWYGQSLAADQHAQFSQLRAIENSRWMLRATNTGLTAAIDHKGRIVAALPQFKEGVLNVEAMPRRGTTPYQRYGDWLSGVLLALLLASALMPVNRETVK